VNFVHIPKTGGQSIEAALGIPNCHETAAYIAAPRFTFVRHPLDRLVSAWVYARKKNNLVRSDMNATAMRELFATKHLVCLPQVFWFDAEIEFVGRFENLAEDFAKVSDKPLPHLNKGDRGPWQQYYDAETLSIAKDFYRADFDRFGYSLED